MINLSLGKIDIMNLSKSAGIFIGNNNKLKSFHATEVTNEVMGVISGDENSIRENQWVKTKVIMEDE
ncbi:hypothetical protein [Neobacillus bataviensis]|uniref:hypothetical protein n=1 Tax=Neobacillus bataviensis TaxID=220685 RepID=UPI001CC0718D|nr:hypothetical protein [Neobacillus bataviensis]